MATTIPTWQEFISLFPEFKDLTQDRFDAWIGIARLFIIEHRWRASYAYGCYLYVAHFLALEKMNQQAAAMGDASMAAAGGLTGISKKVDDVAKSYTFNSNLVAIKNQGQWGKTDYGQRLYQLMRMIGVSPLVS